MGKQRSRSGCLTCRTRHVKCDEKQPECGNCAKGHRVCRQEDRQALIIRRYRGPGQRNDDASSPLSQSSGGLSCEQLKFGTVVSPGSVGSSPHFDSPRLQTLTSRDALLVHHYAVHLGRWLDCTDALQQFSVKIPTLSRQSPILLQAIISFAARHVGDTEAADSAHEKCIAMLIVRLGSEDVANDNVLLCAIVILRVFEQLSAVLTGSDNERHLAGCNALLRASQGSTLDLTAPTLREAAFWIYLRQCLHTACINQQPPHVDFSLQLLPMPSANQGGDESRYLDSTPQEETAWANKIIWLCALVVQFCFGTLAGGTDRSLFHLNQDVGGRLRDWEQLKESIADWDRSKPPNFDPIWEGDEGGENLAGNPFPTLLFTADRHVVAFGFHVLASMLLLAHKPRPRFAVRSTGQATRDDADVESEILQYGRRLCGSCWRAPYTVPARITLCHTVFVWGALIKDVREREGLVLLLHELERDHAWPTAWIISSLRDEWNS
ncbi:uncharacterized protein F5Z01DRAFT_175953 [Emericellopsis atlantica]|uniref:Zn(2)-C6 fungal-type domain-containing protein n=1 Tax=Emericellopsis atlantica TaxID=2614577 RepID=A0A9P8CN58_9HYPO|nr:uncharacterized protein F5Z01DRAFT_175953 [Emericellopsis atlantica]KAG9253153.1 hypothetical protein F5Z01DRAFT_175953 [Emericellopsis atlantica]